jgi:hypothetical protein
MTLSRRAPGFGPLRLLRLGTLSLRGAELGNKLLDRQELFITKSQACGELVILVKGFSRLGSRDAARYGPQEKLA